MNPLPSPTSAPSETLLESMRELTPDAMRDQVTRLTKTDLEHLIRDMNDAKELPRVFEEAGVQQALERRMEELGITMETKDQFNALRSKIDAQKTKIDAKAEKTFFDRLMKKGGGWAIAGSIALTVLSWLGFSKAKALKQSLKEKGYLRTAVEGVKEHPIFSMFLAGIGVKVGSEAYQYFTQNEAPITSRIKDIAKETGTPVGAVTMNLADKLRGIVSSTADAGLRGIVKGTAFVFGGEYDEETGVVSLPGSTLRPPVIVAWQAGVRRRMHVPLFVVEDRLQAILKQTGIVTAGSQEIAGHKKKLASRALEIMKTGTTRGGTAEALELERILDTLSSDMKLDKKHLLDEVHFKPGEAEKRIKTLEADMERIYKTEIEDFRATKDAVQDGLFQTEKQINAGTFKGSVENLKKNAVQNADTRIKEYRQRILDTKLPIAEQLTHALDALAGTGKQGAVAEHAAHALDTETAGGKLRTRFLEGTTRKVEQFGYSMKKVPGGKYVLAGVVGYSFLPLLMEGAAALRPGEKGHEAKKAFTNDLIEAGGGFVPVVGEYLDIKGAITGKDLNGRELDTWQRATMGTLGGLGTVSLVLAPFSGGLSVVGFRTIRGFFAAKKAVKVAKLASQGIEVAGATNKSLKAVKVGAKDIEKLDNMLEITDAQRRIRGVRNTIQNAQRTMQVVTYGHLGVQLFSGMTTLYGNAEHLIEQGKQKVIRGIDIAEQTVTGTAA